jgi:hypothetical protein
MNDVGSTPTAARLTGADFSFFGLVQLLTQHFLRAAGKNPEDPESLNDPRVALVRESLMSRYPEYQRLYAATFVKHVGSQNEAAVLAELASEPLQRYVRARAAMAPEFFAGLRQLTQRMGETEI